MSTPAARDTSTTLIVLVIVGVVLVLSAIGWWFMLTRPPESLESFKRPTFADCFVLNSGNLADPVDTPDTALFMVQFPISTTDSKATIDQMSLLEPAGLEIVGAQLVAAPFIPNTPLSTSDVDAMAPDSRGFFDIPAPTEPGNYLAIIVQRDRDVTPATAEGIAISSFRGEPVYVDELQVAIRAIESGCTAEPKR
jgi:hypothetical protein